MPSLSYRAPKTEVKRSPIHGLGLFARHDIAAGEIVAVKGGYIFSARQWAVLEPRLGDAHIQIEDGLMIAPAEMTERDGAMLYINHSCEPNVGIQGQIVFITMRAIAAGEELTADWATTDDLDYSMTCHCGQRTCRGTVTGRDWMLPALQEKYRGWFCWFLQRKIDRLAGR